MARITQKDLDHILRVTNRKLGTDYIYARANEGLCVETSDNSRKISPRLSVGRLYQWLEAFNDGIDAMEQKIERESAEQAEREREAQMWSGYTNWSTFHVQLVVDNDEGLYNWRNNWIDARLGEGWDVEKMAEAMPDTDFYQEAIAQTAQADEDATEIHIRQQVNWSELAQDNIDDWKERTEYEQNNS